MGKEFIHLAFFDGIGTAELALESIVGKPLAYVSWETCDECIRVLDHHFPHVQHRGDLLSDRPDSVAEFVQQLDPAGRCVVLVSGGPPCPDFSGIAESAQGRMGEEGNKFVKFADFLNRLEKLLRPRDVHILIENVVMQNPADTQFFTDALQAQPVLLDPADFSIISRPRLFWSRVRWCDFSVCPMTQKQLKWQKVNRLPKLVMDLPRVCTTDIDTGGLLFHEKVASGALKLPCLTTPAPSASGRPPPKRMKGRLPEEVKQRWLADSRAYAPWHYRDTALLVDSSGSMGTPSAEVKEQLQGLAQGFTRVEGVPDRSRHRMLANAWHFMVARFMMMVLLQQCGAMAAPCPGPKQNALQFVLGLASVEEFSVGSNRWQQDVCTKPPSFDMWQHWEATQHPKHPLFHSQSLEPGVLQVFHKWHIFGDVIRLRKEVLVELSGLVEAFSDEHSVWLEGLRPHVKKVLQQFGRCVQVPAWMWLLERLGYPEVGVLKQELSDGFPTTGVLTPGVGWMPRLDGRYDFPVSRASFRETNAAYVKRKLGSRFIDEHWKPMLDELVEEQRLGRVEGPFHTPSSWGVPGISVGGLPLLDLEDHEVLAAGCFADWRRSGHNSTVSVADVPLHHSVDDYTACAAHAARQQAVCSTWGHDLEAAYRQLPVRDRHECFTFLRVPDGLCLFRHNSLSFGAVASVWAFNRVADTLTVLARKLIWSPVLHFVDDFGATEPEEFAPSGFDSFADMVHLLGLRTKPKKAQSPSRSQKMLGVFITTGPLEASLDPCPDRLGRILATVRDCLRCNTLKPDEAQTLAGRLNFLQTTCFGRVGSALLAPLYARAHFLQTDENRDNNQLSHALRSTLTALLSLLPECPPRRIPFFQDSPITVLYTDAFFRMGDKMFKPGSPNVPWRWKCEKAPDLVNGWGIVLRIQGEVWVCAGAVPPAVVKVFSKRRAYIYALEILAQVLAFVVFSTVMTPCVCSYIDNMPGQSALQKGFGRDECINNLLAFFWCLVGKQGRFPCFEWIPSQQNIADPISRFDFSIARPEWKQCHPNLDSFWQLILRVADDIQFATSSAVDQCLAWTKVASLVQGGKAEPEGGSHMGSAFSA